MRYDILVWHAHMLLSRTHHDNQVQVATTVKACVCSQSEHVSCFRILSQQLDSHKHTTKSYSNVPMGRTTHIQIRVNSYTSKHKKKHSREAVLIECSIKRSNKSGRRLIGWLIYRISLHIWHQDKYITPSCHFLLSNTSKLPMTYYYCNVKGKLIDVAFS